MDTWSRDSNLHSGPLKLPAFFFFLQIKPRMKKSLRDKIPTALRLAPTRGGTGLWYRSINGLSCSTVESLYFYVSQNKLSNLRSILGSLSLSRVRVSKGLGGPGSAWTFWRNWPKIGGTWDQLVAFALLALSLYAVFSVQWSMRYAINRWNNERVWPYNLN